MIPDWDRIRHILKTGTTERIEQLTNTWVIIMDLKLHALAKKQTPQSMLVYTYAETFAKVKDTKSPDYPMYDFRLSILKQLIDMYSAKIYTKAKGIRKGDAIVVKDRTYDVCEVTEDKLIVKYWSTDDREDGILNLPLKSFKFGLRFEKPFIPKPIKSTFFFFNSLTNQPNN